MNFDCSIWSHLEQKSNLVHALCIGNQGIYIRYHEYHGCCFFDMTMKHTLKTFYHLHLIKATKSNFCVVFSFNSFKLEYYAFKYFVPLIQHILQNSKQFVEHIYGLL